MVIYIAGALSLGKEPLLHAGGLQVLQDWPGNVGNVNVKGKLSPCLCQHNSMEKFG